MIIITLAHLSPVTFAAEGGFGDKAGGQLMESIGYFGRIRIIIGKDECP